MAKLLCSECGYDFGAYIKVPFFIGQQSVACKACFTTSESTDKKQHLINIIFMKLIKTTLISLCVLLPTVACAYDFEIDGIYYKLNGDEAIVTYRGAYATSHSNEYSGNVVIPEKITYNNITYPVTGIDSFAFYECPGLTNISMPNTITYIGTSAFHNCSSLTNIDIPNSVTSLGSSPFHGTAWYNNQPDGLVYIGGFVYHYKGQMPSGTNIFIEEGTKGIAAGAFFGYTGLYSIVIPNSVKIIGGHAFYRCGNLKSVTLGDSVTTIQSEAFNECYALKDIKLPNSVKMIGSNAFSYCYALNSIEIPNSVISLGSNIFENSNISKLLIYGEGEWQGGAINCTTSELFIDSRITSLKGTLIRPSYVYCYATTPPICDENTFTSYSGTLHIPAISLAAYFTASYWCNFTNITGDAVEPILKLNEDNVEMQIGSQFILEASFNQSNAYPNNISWKSTNPDIATVDNGIVTAVGIGECDIIVWCIYREAICHVTVTESNITITLDQEFASVLPNHMLTLTPFATSDVLPELSVISNNPTVAVARIMNGKVQIVGVKEGTTTITVGSVDGTAIPASCLVTVYTEPGDLNCDGFVTISDVTSIIDYLLSGDAGNIKAENADVNGDGYITISDVTSLIDQLLTGEN